MSKPEVLKEQSFEGAIRTPKGAIRKRKFKLRTIGVKRQALKLPKEPGDETEPDSKGSQANPLEKLYEEGRIIRPPYDLNKFMALVEESNVLQECLDAMSVNVGGFGYVFRPRLMPDNAKKSFEKDIVREKIELHLFWESVCTDFSFVEARKRMRRDMESVGNGYFEVIPTMDDKRVAELQHIQGHSIRLGILSDEAQEFSFYRVNPAKNWEIEIVKRKKRFRNFVQVDQSGKKLVWFKEWRDPRKMSKSTGRYEGEKGQAPITKEDEATALAHFKIYNGRSPYGVPRFAGRFPSIEGSRRSEEINYFTMGSNMVPSCFICVEDGELTDETIERLQELLETGIGEDMNYSKFVLLEAETTIEDPMPGTSGKARIRVEPMTKIQPKDQLFQEYDKNNQNKIRQAWRIPPIFIGRADDYTRATADASRRIGDEQVFAPEREAVDWFANQLNMSMGARFHLFKTKTPNITDNNELVKAMGIAEKSGGMTPRRANVLLEDIFDGTIGPLPKGIDPDIPYSLQFAWAQTAGKVAAGEGGGAVSRSIETDWADDYLKDILRD